MRGRKPRPPELKVLSGEKRPSRLNPNHAPRVKGDPEPPDWLGPDERVEFARYVEKLRDLGVLSRTDEGVIARASMRAIQVRDLWAQLAVEGHTLHQTDRQGNPITRANPVVAAINQAIRDWHSFESSMGLTPADRGRVSSTKGGGEEENPYAALRRNG